MFGNVKAERAAVELLYDAICTISRPDTKVSAGIAFKQYTIAAENIPCGLSAAGDSSVQGDANFINDEKTLFIAPETDIRAGDTVTVAVCGIMQDFEAVGIPMMYATHQQVRLIRRDLA